MRREIRSLIAAAALSLAPAAFSQGLPDPGFAPGDPFPLGTVLQDAGTGRAAPLAERHGGRKTLFIAYASW